MKLTRTQMHERAGSLSGEIKAAREAQSECVKALADQERLVTIAAQAVERANARVEELLAERAELAADMAKAILQVGEAPLADEDAPAVAFEVTDAIDGHKEIAWVPQASDPITRSADPFADLHTPSPFPNAIFNGVDRAFEEATQP